MPKITPLRSCCETNRIENEAESKLRVDASDSAALKPQNDKNITNRISPSACNASSNYQRNHVTQYEQEQQTKHQVSYYTMRWRTAMSETRDSELSSRCRSPGNVDSLYLFVPKVSVVGIHIGEQVERT
jgi:pyruvate kinase